LVFKRFSRFSRKKIQDITTHQTQFRSDAANMNLSLDEKNFYHNDDKRGSRFQLLFSIHLGKKMTTTTTKPSTNVCCYLASLNFETATVLALRNKYYLRCSSLNELYFPKIKR